MSRTLAGTASCLSDTRRAPHGTPTFPADTARVFSCDRLVPELVSDHAKQNPGRIALLDDSIQLTYAELDARTERLAHHLQALGVGSNIVVAVCMRRSVLTAVAALAVMKAGAAYLPMDSTHPRERLAFILADANVSIVLSDSIVADRLPEGNWRLILLERHADTIESTPARRQAGQISPHELAYVIYTSGSTGTPKGVEITHGNLLNLVFWHQKAFAITAEDRSTQFTSFGFDAAVMELWPHLTAGAAVHFTPEEVRSSPELLKDWLVAHEITVAFVPTAMAERLILLDWPAATKLRVLTTGADTLHHYPRSGLPFALVNEYGPTECTVVASAGVVATEKKDFEQRPPIGRPIDGAEVYIVDESLRPVPRGEVGELYIGGAGVGRGYVNSPELTAAKFVPDPFANRSDARLYRTGDLGRWLPDGQIEYISRADDLIKVRGYRIEPNEIIAVLDKHPAVQASAVIGRKDGTANQRLVAYIVLNPAHVRPTAAELRDLLRNHLPDYMIPAAFVVLPDLPLTTNGKVDRAALPPDTGNSEPNEDFVSPRTVLEEKLSALVANLLGINPVGVNDNFFLIGGHSLFGTQLIARIRDIFGVELSLRSVFESPTPAQLAQEIERLVVARIGSMSEDEIQHALEQTASGGGQK